MVANSPSPIDCIGVDEVSRRTKLSRATIFRRINARQFPQPFSRRPLRWWVGSIVKWMNARDEAEAEKTRRIEKLSEV